MVKRKKARVLAQVKKWSRAEQLAFFGMLLAYLKAVGVLSKVGRKIPKGGKRPQKGKVPPQLRPYLFKKGHRPARKKKGKRKR